MRKMSDKVQLKDILLNTIQVILKNIKAIQKNEYLKNCQSLKEYKKHGEGLQYGILDRILNRKKKKH